MKKYMKNQKLISLRELGSIDTNIEFYRGHS
jgi:hypothetical protein